MEFFYSFVGAVAIYSYTKSTRQTRDLDFAVASKIQDDELRRRDYTIFEENGKNVDAMLEKTLMPLKDFGKI